MTVMLLIVIGAMYCTIQGDAPRRTGKPVGGGASCRPTRRSSSLRPRAAESRLSTSPPAKCLWTNTDAKKLAGASGGLVVAWLGDEKKANASSRRGDRSGNR